MDIAALAKDLASFLSPFLPYLIKAGDKAVEEAGKKFGADAWHRAKAMWERLLPNVEAKPAAREAVQDLANAPADANALAALRMQLKKLLAEDEALGRGQARDWEEARAAAVVIIEAGERSVAAQSIEGSTIITGDQNVERA